MDPKEVFDLIVTKIPQVLHVDAATIRLLDPSRQKLVIEAASGLSETYLNRGPIDAEESVLAALVNVTMTDIGAHNHWCNVTQQALSADLIGWEKRTLHKAVQPK